MPTVLNVDPDPARRSATTRLLQQEGFQVREAAIGGEALQGATGADLVLLSVDLPDGDGFAVCRRLKGDPATAPARVLLRSGSFVEVGERVRAWQDGADGFLIEPVGPEELAAHVGAVLRARRWGARRAVAVTGLGRLCHDLNGAIQVAGGNTELLLRALRPGDPLRLLAEDIRQALGRLSGLVRQLGGLSRRPPNPDQE